MRDFLRSRDLDARVVAPARARAHRCRIVLAKRRTVSHNRDEFKNSVKQSLRPQLKRHSARREFGPVRSKTQTPNWHKGWFEVDELCDAPACDRLRPPKRNVHVPARRAATANWQAHASRGAYPVKKAGEILACLLRIDKVFVYFTRLKRRASESVEEEAARYRDDAAADRKNGTQIRTDMHKTTPFFFDRLA